MTIELLDTEEAQADDPLDVQVFIHSYPHRNFEMNNLTLVKH